MKQRFFTRTIQSDFIKSLLASTPLPLIHTVSTGDYLIKDNLYIYNRNIIKCTQQGFLRKRPKVVQSTPGSILGGFIIGESLLGVDLLGSFTSLEQVTVSSFINAGRYYLCGDYDPTFHDTNPPLFNNTATYAVGDVVCHFDNDYNRFFVYTAVIPSSHELWNPVKWKWMWSVTVPYRLIYCTRSGTLDGVYSDATYEVVQDFEPAVLNSFYHYLSSKTYYIVINSEQNRTDLIYNEDAGYYPTSEFAEYQIVQSYIPEAEYPLFTEKYLSSYDYYDGETHKKLGNLLRFYRDTYSVDLMPYYNCWNSEYLTNYYISGAELVERNEPSVKLIKIPIQFNKKYTVALECPSEVKILPAFIKNNQLLQVRIGQSDALDLTSLFNNNHSIVYNQFYFNKPVLYESINKSQELVLDTDQTITDITLTMSQLFQMFEDNFYLIIQIPFNVSTSLVVLEGDYTDSSSKITFNLEFLEKMSAEELNKCLTSQLSLLQINDGISYPFADRLVEFLLKNVITQNDEIGEDIVRVRNDISDYLVYDADSISWSPYLRKTLYDLYCSSQNTVKLDISGYVDKNMEYYISNLKGG